jgi:hypothetical protein
LKRARHQTSWEFAENFGWSSAAAVRKGVVASVSKLKNWQPQGLVFCGQDLTKKLT